MTFDQILAKFYEGVPVEELADHLSELAAEKAAELEGPNSPEYDRLTEKFYEEFLEELNGFWS